MEVTTETITPEKALEYLSVNTHNRKVKDMAVSRYARDMKLGRWLETGDAIKFAQDGSLLDGQNRLYACIESEAPFTTLVVRDVDPSAQEAMDQGVGRSAADALKLRGLTGNSNTAAAVRLILRWDWGYIQDQRGFNSVHTVQDITEFVTNNADLLDESMVAGSALARAIKVLNPAAVTFYFLAARAGADRADLIHFTEGTISGVGLEHGDPRLALRHWAMVGFGADRHRNLPAHLQAIIRTWNRYVERRPLGYVRLGEAIPDIKT